MYDTQGASWGSEDFEVLGGQNTRFDFYTKHSPKWTPLFLPDCSFELAVLCTPVIKSMTGRPICAVDKGRKGAWQHRSEQNEKRPKENGRPPTAVK